MRRRRLGAGGLVRHHDRPVEAPGQPAPFTSDTAGFFSGAALGCACDQRERLSPGPLRGLPASKDRGRVRLAGTPRRNPTRGHIGAFLDLLIGGAAFSGTGLDDRIGWDFGNPLELWETSMRLPILTLLLIAAALLGESFTAPAQSAGSHPVCAIYYVIDADGTPACAFDTREQCMEDISGIGGFCIENQYYHGPAVRPPSRVHVMRKRASTHSHQTSLR